MKINNRTRRARSCLWTAALISIVATLAARAASPPSASTLNARVIARPVTPGDVALYKLPASTEYSGGLNTIGVGTPAYLEVDVAKAASLSFITNITWTVTAPLGSAGYTNPAALFSPTPLTTNMPVFLPSDRSVYQVAGRTLLRPDFAAPFGTDQPYVVTATIGTTNGTTNVSISFNVGTYVGVLNGCIACHDTQGAGPTIYPYWTNTGHARIFTEGIDGTLSSHYNVTCIKCHTVGYDTNASSLLDGGFYAVQQSDHWSFPTTLASTNYAAMPENLQNLANIQCENCHGPGSVHAYEFGLVTNLIDVPYTAGACEQCHDDPPGHPQGAQWYASSHAIATTTPSGTGRDACVQCHTTVGFITAVSNRVSGATVFGPTNTAYSAIGCQTCHEPHGITTPTNDNHLIRIMSSATFGDGTVITNGGEGILCMNCHHSRNGSAVTNVLNYSQGLPTWYGSSVPPSSRDFGVHENPQGDMLEGVNAITYGLSIPSSAHRYSVTNSCVGCHMQTVASTDPGFLLSGEHTWEMSYTVVTNGLTNKIDQVAVCNQCHGGITSFNFPVEDYANTGSIQGVQTEVQILLNQLSTLLPNSKGVVTGQVQSSLSPATNWTVPQLQAAYNYQFVANDGSMGVHNAPFATGLLKASIANLTGTSVAGGLPDAWEVSNFTSITNAAGAPDAVAADGLPNWLNYALGLNPNAAPQAIPGGIVYANGGSLGGSTNHIQIYTAAEIVFNTQPGWSYQIQEVSALSDGWANIGTNIVATTNTGSMSYLTPTVGTVQQFFRVVETPP